MRKYIKICTGLIRLFFEELLNGFKIKIHGISYCVNSGVKFWVHDGGSIDLGKKTWLSENTIFECGGGLLVLGYNNFFNSNCRIASIQKITIGDNNLFGPNVIIVDHDHKYSDGTQLICKQGFTNSEVTIGSDNWVGGNVTICQGVTIGNHVVIGANSLVNKDCVEPGVYAGIPAKKIKDIQLHERKEVIHHRQII